MASYIPRGSALTAADIGFTDRFGAAVAVSADGAVLAVGATQWDGSFSNQGGVYIYDWSGGAWVQRGSVLVAADAAASRNFGYSVSLSGDGAVLAVGDQYWDGSFSDQGGVYIFDWSGGAWVQRGSVLVAPDPAVSDYFGASVALSDDGTIIAVGAYQWEGAATDQGGVYIFDYAGAVWTQRGSVITKSGAANYDYFGQSVALSGTGTVLAVGAQMFTAVPSYSGAVVVYDWSGSAWTQRGVITAADAAASDLFGRAVALSNDGLLLAVGANQWEGATSNQGGVYLFNDVAGSWVQDGSVMVSAEASSGEAYAESVALSGDGAIMVIGAPRRDMVSGDEGAVYVRDLEVVVLTGTPTAPTELTIALATGAPLGYTDLTVLASSGAPLVYTELTMLASTGAPLAYTELTLSWPTGTASAPSALTVTASGAPAAPTVLAVLGAGHVPTWRARCVIDGVDVSAQLVGQASVTADEGAARIAQLTLQPPAGLINPLDYVGRTISLDYVLVIGGVDVPRRLFTGRIDTPAYDPDTTLLALTCTDDLQNRVAALDRSVIDALIGGRYSEAVQGELDDNWDYARAQLETVAASLDAGASGGMRLTQWEAAAVWATWDESDLLYQRASLSLPQRSTMINRVDIEFAYRFPRLRQRYAWLGWSAPQNDIAPAGYIYPSVADILSAAGGAGWDVVSGVFWPAPVFIPVSVGFPTARIGKVYPAPGSVDMAKLYMGQRNSQTVTETHTLIVRAPESITANGELPQAMRGALASSFNGQAWEAAQDVLPLLPDGGELNYAPDATRADADYAIQTLLDRARVKIVGSHRSARVGNAVLCNPDLDVDKRIAIATAEIAAEGKVASVTHLLDFDAGSAVSDFELAIFGAGGAGIITPDSLDARAVDEDAAADADNWPSALPGLGVYVNGINAYSADDMGLLADTPPTVTVVWDDTGETEAVPNSYFVSTSYPVTGFRIRMPGVADVSRNPLDVPIAEDYSILIPSDPLALTIP